MAFLGIPYARVERFMPPLPVEKWDTIRVCDHFGPQAMQQTGGRELSEGEMSEQNSCVLNVWTTDKKGHRPVMLWLHGGGFESGTSAWDPGMCLAKKLATRLRGVNSSASNGSRFDTDADDDQELAIAAPEASFAPEIHFHKVKKGESLQSIARKRGMTVDALCKLNHIGKNIRLMPGQILKYN